MTVSKREVKPVAQMVARIATGNTAAEIAAVLSEVPDGWTFKRHDYIALHSHRTESGDISDVVISVVGLAF